MKFKQRKGSKQTLSDKIADALTIKPRADIEDDQIFGTKPNTVSRVDFSSSDEDEAAISDFRKQNVNLLSDISKKYEGEVVAKKVFEDSSDSGSENENGFIRDKSDLDSDNGDENELEEDENVSDTGDDNEDYSITKFQKQLQSDSEESQSGSEGSDEDGKGYDISQLEEPMKEEFEHIKKKDVSEEAKKGISVRNQLLLWEGLLEMRIHLQRCMNTANMMPMSDSHAQMKEKTDFASESQATISNISTLLDKFLTLQNTLFSKFPETKSLVAGKSNLKDKQSPVTKEESDEEIPSDTDNEEIPSDTDEETTNNKPDIKLNKTPKKRKLEDYEKEISTTHKQFKSFRDSTIQKWNEKTRVATATNIKNAPSNTILQQISYILSDKPKLIRRTQLKRSDYEIIGYKKGAKEEQIMKNRKDDDEYIPEIFDDSDFYHQLLRELIECKSADITDPVQLSRQWIALQQMRSKMKRKVDTKATKGRKIKYVVHNSLVSYMAPQKSTKWNYESTNELYSSLFGKLFEHNNVGLNVDLDKK